MSLVYPPQLTSSEYNNKKSANLQGDSFSPLSSLRTISCVKLMVILFNHLNPCFQLYPQPSFINHDPMIYPNLRTSWPLAEFPKHLSLFSNILFSIEHLLLSSPPARDNGPGHVPSPKNLGLYISIKALTPKFIRL